MTLGDFGATVGGAGSGLTGDDGQVDREALLDHLAPRPTVAKGIARWEKDPYGLPILRSPVEQSSLASNATFNQTSPRAIAYAANASTLMGLPEAEALRVGTAVERVLIDNPSLEEPVGEGEFIRLAMMTDLERSREAVLQALGITTETPSLAFYETVLEQLEEAQWKVVAANTVRSNAQEEYRSPYALTSEREESVRERLLVLEPDAQRRVLSVTAVDDEPAAQIISAVEQLENLRGPERKIEHFLSPDGTRIVTDVEYKAPGADGSPGEGTTYSIVLDEGTVITSREDLLYHTLLAQSGYAHEIIGDAPRVKGRDALLSQAVTPSARVVANVMDETVFRFRSEEEERERSRARERRTEEIRGELGSFEFVLAAGAALVEDGLTPMDAYEQVAAWAQEPGSDRQIASTMAEASAVVDIEASLAELDDDRPVLKQMLDDSVETFLNGVEFYDGIIHKGGMGLLSLFGGFLEVTDEALEAVGLKGLPLIEDDFPDLFEWISRTNESERISDFFGITGQLANWVDISASVMLDPFLWVTPGGKGLAQLARRRLATKEGARELVRHPITRGMMFDIEQAAINGRVEDVYVMLHGAGLTKIAGQLSDYSTFKAAAEMQGISPRQHLSNLVEEALPANKGLAIVDWSRGPMIRNSVDQARWIGRNWSQRGPKWERLRNQLAIHPKDRELALYDIEEIRDFYYAWGQARISYAKQIKDKALRGEAVESARKKFVFDMQEVDRLLATTGPGTDAALRKAAEDQVERLTAELQRLGATSPDEIRLFGRRSFDDAEKIEAERLTLAGRTDDVSVKRLNEIEGGADRVQAMSTEIRKLAQEKGVLKQKKVGALGIGDLQTWRAAKDRLEEVEALLKEYGAEVKGLRNRGFHVFEGTELENFRAATSAYDTELSRLQTALKDAKLQAKKTNVFGGRQDRINSIDQFFARVQDDILEIAEWRGVDPADLGFDINGKLDWSGVTGRKWQSAADDAGVSLEENLKHLGDDPKIIDILSESMGRMPSYARTPASVYELVAFVEAANAKGWARRMLTGVTESEVAQFASTWVSKLHRLWAASLLLTPRTAIRSNLDEIFSVAADKGRVLSKKNAIVDIDDITGKPIRETVAGPARIAGGQWVSERFLGRSMDSFRSQRSLIAGQRFQDMSSPFARTSEYGYKTIAKGEAGHASAVSRLLNGYMPTDPVMGAYARFDGDWAAWKKWWDEEGPRAVGNEVHAGTKAKNPTARQVFNAREKTIDYLVGGFPAKIQAEIRSELMKAAANPSYEINFALLRQYKRPVVGHVNTTKAGVVDRAFDLMYGGVGARRFGLVHQMHYSDTLEILWEAKTKNGTLLTSDRLARLEGISHGEAEVLLRTVPYEVLERYQHMGMYLPQQLKDQADRVARTYAKAQAFTPGASTLMGKKFQMAFPFGPAQVDYIGRYTKLATETAHIGLNPTVQNVLKDLPVFGPLFDPMNGVRFLGSPIAGHVFGHRIPVNLRLAGHMMALSGGLASQREKPRPDQHPDDVLPPGGYSPSNLLSDGTFFPADLRPERVIMDVIPQLGPLPAAILTAFPPMLDEVGGAEFVEKIRDQIEVLQPAVGWLDPPNGDPIGFITDIVLPRSDRSLRGYAEQFAKTLAMATVGLNPDDYPFPLSPFIALLNTAAEASQPRYYQRVVRAEYGDHLVGNHPIGGSEGDEILEQITADAYRITQSQDAQRVAFGTIFAFGQEPITFGADAIKHWLPLADGDTLDALRREGVVSEVDAETIIQLAAAAESGEDADTRRFSDAAYALWRKVPKDIQSRLLVLNRNLAVNVVGQYRCAMDSNGEPLNADYCEPDGSFDLPPGDKGRDLFMEGHDDGWIVYKSDKEWKQDVDGRLGSAGRHVISELWEQIVGVKWSGVKGQPKSADENFLYITQTGIERLEEVRVNVRPFGTLESDGTWRISRLDLARAVELGRDSWPGTSFLIDDQPAWKATSVRIGAAFEDSPQQAEAALMVRDTIQALEDEYEGVAHADWPLIDRNRARAGIRWLVDYQFMDQQDYEKELSNLYGPLDYEPPTFDDWSTLSNDWKVIGEDKVRSVTAIDGDTVTVELKSGDEVRVRLIGINAQDFTGLNFEADIRYRDQLERMERLLRDADTITFGAADPERFTLMREVGIEGEMRYNLVMYVNGMPITDPEVFSPQRPSGAAGFIGNGVPKDLLEQLVGG